jgi:hypothetical protein
MDEAVSRSDGTLPVTEHDAKEDILMVAQMSNYVGAVRGQSAAVTSTGAYSADKAIRNEQDNQALIDQLDQQHQKDITADGQQMKQIGDSNGQCGNVVGNWLTGGDGGMHDVQADLNAKQAAVSADSAKNNALSNQIALALQDQQNALSNANSSVDNFRSQSSETVQATNASGG